MILHNPRPSPVRVEFRWAGETDWQTKSVPANGKACLYKLLATPTDDLPKLECKMSAEPVTELAPKRWSGKGLPSFNDGAKYRITAGSKTRDLEPEPVTDRPPTDK